MPFLNKLASVYSFEIFDKEVVDDHLGNELDSLLSLQESNAISEKAQTVFYIVQLKKLIRFRADHFEEIINGPGYLTLSNSAIYQPPLQRSAYLQSFNMSA